MKRGRAAVTVCSTPFAGLGRAQAKALGCASLPIALMDHPFGTRSPAELPLVADDIVRQILQSVVAPPVAAGSETSAAAAPAPAARVSIPEDIEAANRYFREQRWTDGLPAIPPTPERVERALAHTARPRLEIVARVPPAFGAATVERIAINAVMAGADPAALDVLVTAIEAVTAPEFNLQGVQATTNPAAVWLIVNGPVAEALRINGGPGCLGQGTWENATLGRALRLLLQNVGGALPGEMDRATHGQPGRLSLCCTENVAASPWEPLGVERGTSPAESSVTLVAFSGTLNLNTHTKNADDLLLAFADAMAHAPSNDYWCGGEPWVVLCPEHAAVLARAGYSKAGVKRRLWELSRMPGSRMAPKDFERTQRTRRGELGEITPQTLLPICPAPEGIGLLVAGGEGTHSVYLPGFGNSRSVTRRVQLTPR